MRRWWPRMRLPRWSGRCYRLPQEVFGMPRLDSITEFIYLHVRENGALGGAVHGGHFGASCAGNKTHRGTCALGTGGPSELEAVQCMQRAKCYYCFNL